MNQKEQSMNEKRKQETYSGYCQECGCFKQGVLKTNKITTTVRGVKVKAEIYELYCEECGELLTSKEIQKYNDIIIYDAYKSAVNLLTSREIKKIRERRGWSQTQMAEFLGLGEKDITRYENGSIQTKNIDKMMRLLTNDFTFILVEAAWSNKDLLTDPFFGDKVVMVSNDLNWAKAYKYEKQKFYPLNDKKESEKVKNDYGRKELQLAAN